MQAKFTSDAPPEVFEKYCLETFKARFKEHRGELSKHFKKFASEEEARQNPPAGVSVDDWAMLCTRFTAESFKVCSLQTHVNTYIPYLKQKSYQCFAYSFIRI